MKRSPITVFVVGAICCLAAFSWAVSYRGAASQFSWIGNSVCFRSYLGVIHVLFFDVTPGSRIVRVIPTDHWLWRARGEFRACVGSTLGAGYVVYHPGPTGLSFTSEGIDGTGDRQPAIAHVWIATAPIWGIPISIAVFVGSYFVLLSWQRAVRRSYGCCAFCGYNLRASPGVCPECGRP